MVSLSKSLPGRPVASRGSSRCGRMKAVRFPCSLILGKTGHDRWQSPRRQPRAVADVLAAVRWCRQPWFATEAPADTDSRHRRARARSRSATVAAMGCSGISMTCPGAASGRGSAEGERSLQIHGTRTHGDGRRQSPSRAVGGGGRIDRCDRLLSGLCPASKASSGPYGHRPGEASRIVPPCWSHDTGSLDSIRCVPGASPLFPDAPPARSAASLLA